MSQSIGGAILLAVVLSWSPLGCTAAGRGYKSSLSTTSTTATRPTTATPSVSTPFKAVCSGTRFPALCEQTLSTTSLPTKTPTDLARATVSSALSSARTALTVLTRNVTPSSSSVNDCKERMGNSIDKLSSAFTELGRLKPQTLSYQLNNAKTWVSAAMTNADTCVATMGKVAVESVKRVSTVTQNSSNALFFISRLATTKKNAGRN